MVNLSLSKEAEDYLRGAHNHKKGDMGDYISNLILTDKATQEAKKCRTTEQF